MATAGLALGAAGTAGYVFWREPAQRQGLGRQAVAIMQAVCEAVLEGSLAQQGGASMQAWSERFVQLVDALPEATQAELSDLLMLLNIGAGRLLLCGHTEDWRTLSRTELRERLGAMRSSALALRQQAYHALRDLTHAAYYAHPDTWPAIGYGGPVAL